MLAEDRLSGGQKAKVLLLKMSMSGANVLILDEFGLLYCFRKNRKKPEKTMEKN